MFFVYTVRTDNWWHFFMRSRLFLSPVFDYCNNSYQEHPLAWFTPNLSLLQDNWHRTATVITTNFV